jgi:phage/plasmid-associated DNA primase
MIHQSVYLLQLREHIKSKEPIYKIGRTGQEHIKRFKQYPKDSILFFQQNVFNCYVIEREIIKLFKIKYKQRRDIGIEYFEGDKDIMIKNIQEICNAEALNLKNEKIDIITNDTELIASQNNNTVAITNQIDSPYTSIADDDIALVFYNMNKNTFVCAKESPQMIWFKLNDDCMWERLAGVPIMRKIIKKQLIPVYKKEINIITNLNSEKDITKETIELNNKNIKKINDVIIKIKTYEFLTKVIGQLVTYYLDQNFIEKIDNNPDIMCFGNEIFDLIKCEWRYTLPSDCCSFKCGVKRSELNNDNIDALNTILLDIFTTEERKQYMLNQFSMFLTGRNEAQSFFIWLGAGANGKSLLQDYFKHAFGDYYCALLTSLITGGETPPSSANSELCRGKGKRIAFFSEPEEGKKANNSILKKWSGGDRISCRELYEKQIEYDILFKMVIECNTKFELQDVSDDSIPRRTNYCNFKTKFINDEQYKKQNRVLFDYQKLRVDEYKSIEFIDKIKGTFMYMLVENYKKLKHTNFKYDIPKDMICDRDQFLDNNNEVKVFLKNEYEFTASEKDYISVKDLFSAFNMYGSKNHMKITMKEKDFKTRVSEDVPFKACIQPYINGKQVKIRSVFTNIKARDDDEDDEKDKDNMLVNGKDKDNMFVDDK